MNLPFEEGYIKVLLTKSHEKINPLQRQNPDKIYWKQALSLKKAGYQVIHLAVSDENLDFVSEHGVRMIQVKRYKGTGNLFFNNLSKRFSYRNEYRKLLAIARELKAEAYHLHDLQLNKIARQLQSLPHRPRLVYDVHEPYPITIADGEYKGFLFKRFMKLYARYVYHWELKTSAIHDMIIATEENVAEKFSNQFTGKKVEIICNYCDTGAKDFPEEAEKMYDFIYAGGIRRRRGAMEMLKAVKLLKDENFAVRLLIVNSTCTAGGFILLLVLAFGMDFGISTFFLAPALVNAIFLVFR
ncbi:MAG: hypothetical protein EA361_05915 [Bacteroidetes bacterium]|nr:MAG: hypothetical protein EA361_05915 [Bacteroidota bacterium]